MSLINDFFEKFDEGNYHIFKDSNGVQLNVGDFIRMNYWMNALSGSSYKVQSLYRINFNMKSGIFFELIGSYREEFQTEMPEARIPESDYEDIDFPPDSVIYFRDIDFEEHIYYGAKDYRYTKVLMSKVDINDVFKVHWMYYFSLKLLKLISEESYMIFRDSSVEDREKYIIENKDSINLDKLYTAS